MSEAYPHTIEGICHRVSARLGDFDEDKGGTSNESWSECLVKSVVLDTLAMVSLLKPDLFTEEIAFALESGSCLQKLPEECNRLVGFSCVETPAGTVPVVMGDYRSIENVASFPPIRRMKCSGRLTSSLGIASFTAAISTTNPRSFVINPLPANGEQYKMVAECISLEDFSDSPCDPLPDELRPWIIPLVELSLYQLKSIDSTDAAATQQSQAHLQTFLNLTAVSLAQVRNALDEVRQVGAANNAA